MGNGGEVSEHSDKAGSERRQMQSAEEEIARERRDGQARSDVKNDFTPRLTLDVAQKGEQRTVDKTVERSAGSQQSEVKQASTAERQEQPATGAKTTELSTEEKADRRATFDASRQQDSTSRIGSEFGNTTSDKTQVVEKIGEALLETYPFKEIKESAEKKGEAFISTLHGKIITGAAAAGVISMLAVMNAELPMQVPEIPLDRLLPGLSVRLEYKGPVRNPTEASITFTYREQVGTSGEKDGMTKSERIRAENARIIADQEAFREGLKTPEQREKETRQFGQAVWNGRDRFGLGSIGTQGPKHEAPVLQRKESATRKEDKR